jgi:hypothetical protein
MVENKQRKNQRFLKIINAGNYALYLRNLLKFVTTRLIMVAQRKNKDINVIIVTPAALNIENTFVILKMVNSLSLTKFKKNISV